MLQSTSTVLEVLKSPLKEQGLEYGKMQGGLLSGLVIEDLNYQNQVKAKKVQLKVDWKALRNRVLVVDNLVLEDAEIDKGFLDSLLDSNGSESNSSESNLTLPFDQVIVNNADISLKNVVYDAYKINYAKLHIDNLDTDMKKNHKGKITFLLDSNVSKVDLKGDFENENYDVVAKIEGEKNFIEPFLKDADVKLLSNPDITIKAKGNLEKVHYDVEVHRLDLRQNEYEVHSEKLHTVGEYHIINKELVNALQTQLSSNVGALTLKSDVSVDIDDINHTLLFDIDGKFLPKESHLVSGLVEQNITIEQFPTIALLAKGDMMFVNFSTKIMGLKAEQNGMRLDLKKLDLKGDAKPLQGDINIKGTTLFDSSVADGFVNLTTSLNYKDINNSLEFDTDTDLKIHGLYVNNFLADANATLNGDSQLKLLAKGDMQNVKFSTSLKGLKGKQNDLAFHLKDLDLKGDAKPLQGDINLKAYSLFDSSVADGFLNLTTSLNYKDINNSLEFDTDTDLKIHGFYVNNFLADANVTLNGESHLKLLAKGDMENVKFSTSFKGLKGKQNDIAFHLKDLDLKGDAKPLQGDINLKAYSLFDSSVADGVLNLTTSVNYKDVNNSLKFDTDSELQIHGTYVNNFLADANVTLNGDSKLKLLAKGDMENVTFSTSLKGLNGKQNDIAFHLKDLDVKGDAKPLQGDVNVKAYTKFDSSIADGLLKLTTKLNYKDINNTLEFDTDTDLKIHGSYVNNFLSDANVTLEGDSQLKLTAKGTLQNAEFKTLLQGVKGKQNDISFELKDLNVKGETKPLQGDTSIVALTHFSSSVADGEVDAKVKLNFNDINNSLELDTLAKLDAHALYLNPLLKEHEVALKGDSHIELKAQGKLNSLTLNLDAKADVLKDKKISSITLHSSPIILNFFSHQISGAVDMKSEGGDIGLNIKTNFSGDYTKPKEMEIKNKIEVGHFSAFGLDLTSLEPLALDVQNKDGGLVVRLDSPKIKLTAQSKDNDHFTFDLKTEQINLSKIIELPEELQNKLIQVDLAGEVTVSKQYFVVKGLVESNEGFQFYIDAKNNINGLDAKLSTQHLKLVATGNLEQKEIEAKITIDSLFELQEEFIRLYAFSIVEIDGALTLDASLKNEEVLATLSSEQIMLKDFNIEALKLDAHYVKDLLTLNTFNFKTRGFGDKSLNQDFYLNQKALINLGEKRDIFLDMHPSIYVNATGTKENLNGDFRIKKLPLGHPEYGSMILNCDINYDQFGLKKNITGSVVLERMKLFYEAKFLDADYDSDVIVITKKDKKKQNERDTFLEDTYIDLSIIAPDAKYKTRDIDLKFTVDVKAKKEFGETLGMVGQVKEINGRVEQAPKLFTVVDSTIVFGGGKEINPLLDIQVDYKLPDVLITILIHGNAKRPKLDFSSEPPMPKKDILSYLLLGVSTASLAEGEGSLGREAQLFIMNQAARDLAYEVELDRVFIKDDGTGEGYAIQIGKKVNEKTMAVIENSKEGNSFILEYEVSKNIKVEIGHHQKTVPSQSIDIFFRKKFK